MTDALLSHYSQWSAIALMALGLFSVVRSGNLVRKLLAMAVFQTAVLLLYISGAYVDGGAAPILKDGVTLYVNPLPHVLTLTAIVVGIATMAVGLALAVRIKEEYGTIEDTEILALDAKEDKRKKS